MPQIDPETTYLVRQPTAHPVMENWRVRSFRQLLQLPAQHDGGEDEKSEQLAMLGEIMYQVILYFFSASYPKPGALLQKWVYNKIAPVTGKHLLQGDTAMFRGVRPDNLLGSMSNCTSFLSAHQTVTLSIQG